jgi:hypothetical protein
MTAGMITQMQLLLWILQNRCALKPIKGAMNWEGLSALVHRLCILKTPV